MFNKFYVLKRVGFKQYYNANAEIVNSINKATFFRVYDIRRFILKMHVEDMYEHHVEFAEVLKENGNK